MFVIENVLSAQNLDENIAPDTYQKSSVFMFEKLANELKKKLDLTGLLPYADMA